MTIDTRPTALYRTDYERAVRAPSPAAAAWKLAKRMARREFGRRAGATVQYLGMKGGEPLYEARIGLACDVRHGHGCETLHFRVRKDA